eukprot:5237595-Amphidinium_carterae.2
MEWSQHNMTALQQLEDDTLTARLQRHMEQTAVFLTKVEDKEGGTPGAHVGVPTVAPTIVHQTHQQVAITITPGPAWKTTEFEESDMMLVGDNDVMTKEAPPLKMTENTWARTLRVAGIVKVRTCRDSGQRCRLLCAHELCLFSRRCRRETQAWAAWLSQRTYPNKGSHVGKRSDAQVHFKFWLAAGLEYRSGCEQTNINFIDQPRGCIEIITAVRGEKGSVVPFLGIGHKRRFFRAVSMEALMAYVSYQNADISRTRASAVTTQAATQSRQERRRGTSQNGNDSSSQPTGV